MPLVGRTRHTQDALGNEGSTRRNRADDPRTSSMLAASPDAIAAIFSTVYHCPPTASDG